MELQCPIEWRAYEASVQSSGALRLEAKKLAKELEKELEKELVLIECNAPLNEAHYMQC